MGHTLAQADTAGGSFVFSLEYTITRLDHLYRGLPPPVALQSKGTPKQLERNAQILAKYEGGVSAPDLAKQHGVSVLAK